MQLQRLEFQSDTFTDAADASDDFSKGLVSHHAKAFGTRLSHGCGASTNDNAYPYA
jgi:hypothetical protein